MTVFLPISQADGSKLDAHVRERLAGPMPLHVLASILWDARAFSASVITQGPIKNLGSADPQWSLSSVDPAAAIRSNEALAALLAYIGATREIERVVVELPWNQVTDLDPTLAPFVAQGTPGVAVRVGADEPRKMNAAAIEALGYPGGELFGLRTAVTEPDALLVVALPAFDHETFIILKREWVGPSPDELHRQA